MRVAVVGAGAVGGVVAWHLAAAGRDPLIVARASTAARLAADGLFLETGGTARHTPVRVTSDPGSAGPHDVVIVGFKAHDWQAGLSLVTPLIGPKTLVVPLLNGIPFWYLDGLDARFGARDLTAVDPGGVIAKAIPSAQILGCVVYIGANRPDVNRFDWNGRKRLILGEVFGAPSQRLTDLVANLKAAGIDAEASPDIRAAVWEKLLGNASYNPISALTRATIDGIAGDPGTRAVARAIMLECISVARALGVTAPFDVEARLTVAPVMKGVKTSMLQDMEAGRSLELGAIVEAVVELGRRVGVATPILETTGALAARAWTEAWGR
ncbi:MAG: 2-dehydropantoate 2-reductase [Alphaproteobacteria bacterium]